MAATCVLCGADDPAAVTPVCDLGPLRVVRVIDQPDYPAYWRVIWRAHVAEFSDLDAADRLRCMDVVATVERVMLEALAPAKVNLASLGNMVPHLHWHLIARHRLDAHFPQAIWAPRQRESGAGGPFTADWPAIDARIRQALGVDDGQELHLGAGA
ncbi:diadenosine tetraphosphate (Ap4A) HIT family hydrolase [Sphaerotilus hippei]|uniref:Diadenosine tetraphosphate (Ap4A) HIT family hydrolase n=1 Tax=Sphaerotilus hippei TaxID=744406 RepID=A0A318GWW1_9BURK|nr:HIT family protein [Sphaerotilus hippei]PXW94119.1 diadenosine tetraphosphate (Ap4A) HIT family hydrolase [Sphaerotilus hippei]